MEKEKDEINESIGLLPYIFQIKFQIFNLYLKFYICDELYLEMIC